jgi:GTP-binding protein
MFVDVATVKVKAGNGGDGAVSFRQEKYVDKGGPDGGDGGRGGHIILQADENLNTLVKFRHNQEVKAKNGETGRKRRQHGANGEDLIVPVPVGTVVSKDGEIVTDLTEHNQEAIIAKGGDGGFGNAHFKSSTRQAPRVAELGEKGEEFTLKLELKLLADIGLVGFPNAGKSTFLSVVSNAKPEIADYAFTTLTPNLGVADFDEHSLLIADIPGLIKGASEGKGLGDEFLRHIERTAVLLHLIDIYDEDVAKAYKTITDELKARHNDLAKRPRIVILTKTEGLEPGLIEEQAKKLKKVAKKSKVMAISSQAHTGLTEVLREAYKLVSEVREAEKAIKNEESPDVPVIELDQAEKEAAWQVRIEAGRFIVTGEKIEKFAARTDFNNQFGIARLRDIMRKMGVTHELVRKGAKPEDTVVIGESGDYQLKLQ